MDRADLVRLCRRQLTSSTVFRLAGTLLQGPHYGAGQDCPLY